MHDLEDWSASFLSHRLSMLGGVWPTCHPHRQLRWSNVTLFRAQFPNTTHLAATAVRQACEPGARHAISSWCPLLGWLHLFGRRRIDDASEVDQQPQRVVLGIHLAHHLLQRDRIVRQGLSALPHFTASGYLARRMRTGTYRGTNSSPKPLRHRSDTGRCRDPSSSCCLGREFASSARLLRKVPAHWR